jgi:predicted deacetylase
MKKEKKRKIKERKNSKPKKILILIGLFLLTLIPILSLTRIISPFQIDDLHPSIKCSELNRYNPEILWVIPKFEGVPISQNKTWCDKILSLNKTLGMHGIGHKYKEFEGNITKEKLEEAINIFEDCFGFKPELFKPPQLTISKENKELLKEQNLKIKNRFNHLTHKVYQCEDTGLFSNEFIRFF